MANSDIPYASLDTPVVLVDLDKLEANIREMVHLANEAGVKLRPHTKIHGSAFIAKMQIEAGACGIEVGPVEQAEGMAEGGLNDILIAHPFYGGHKLETLKRILKRPGIKLTIVVDMFEQAEGISQVGQAVGKRVPMLIKLDTGANRYGVLPGEPVLNLAKKLLQLPGIELAGIYAHEYKDEAGGKWEKTSAGVEQMAFDVASMVSESVKLLRRERIIVEHASVGASPTFRATCRYIKEGKFPEITEIHPGHCAIGDIASVRALGNIREACSVTVLTTVISTSHPDHAVIDAGQKTFSNDSLSAYRETPGFFWEGKPSFGSVQGRPDLWLGHVPAEVSRIFYMDPEKKLSLGERLEIVPNNATLVIDMHNQIYGVRKGTIERVISVTGRNRGN